jgi:hypothetical protein
MIRGAVDRLWHTSSAIKTKFQTDHFNSQDHMHTVLEQKSVLLVKLLPQGSTINAGVYCDTLKKLRPAIQNKRWGMLTRGVVMPYENARPHTAATTQDLIATFGWEQFDHPLNAQT